MTTRIITVAALFTLALAPDAALAQTRCTTSPDYLGGSITRCNDGTRIQTSPDYLGGSRSTITPPPRYDRDGDDRYTPRRCTTTPDYLGGSRTTCR